MDELTEIFGEPIFVYTRAQAIADGELVDVSKEAGQLFKYPVAITRALHADIDFIPASLEGIASYAGRLWDVLWMGAMAASGRIGQPNLYGRSRFTTYDLQMSVEGRSTEMYTVKAVCGPGDGGEPVVTLMRPDED